MDLGCTEAKSQTVKVDWENKRFQVCLARGKICPRVIMCTRNSLHQKEEQRGEAVDVFASG